MITRRRRVRRIVVRVAVLLLLGAVVNVAVAWGLALRQPELSETARSRSMAFFDSKGNGVSPMFEVPSDTTIVIDVRDYGEGVWELWKVYRNEGTGSCRYRSIRNRIKEGAHWRPRHSPEWLQYPDPAELLRDWPNVCEPSREFASGATDGEGRIVEIRGWPCLSVVTFSGNLGQLESQSPRKMGIEVGYTTDRFELVLPLQPIWPGFAINTMFYAAILWLLFAAPGRVRRWRRIRRGLCVKCAYPIGPSEVCTECGADINKKIKARRSMGLPPVSTGDSQRPAPPAGSGSERIP